MYVILKEIYQLSEPGNSWVAKALMSHTFFVKFLVFKPVLEKTNLTHRDQFYSERYSCHVLSIFRTDIFLAQSEIETLILVRQILKRTIPLYRQKSIIPCMPFLNNDTNKKTILKVPCIYFTFARSFSALSFLDLLPGTFLWSIRSIFLL